MIDELHYTELWDKFLSHKPLICIPKTGDILLVDITRTRYLIIIGPLVISSVSGVWWRKRRVGDNGNGLG